MSASTKSQHKAAVRKNSYSFKYNFSAPTLPSSSTQLSKVWYKTAVILILKFIGAIVDQSYDIYMIVFLANKGQSTFAVFFLLADLLPAVLIMWQIFLNNKKKCSWNILCYCCHPINMLIRPMIVFWEHIKPKTNNEDTCMTSKQKILDVCIKCLNNTKSHQFRSH